MSKVVAINQASAKAVEDAQLEIAKDQFKDFIMNDPDVRAMMLAKVKAIIDSLSSWDVSYHGGFKDVTGEILRSEDLKSELTEAIKRVLGSEKDINCSVYEAIGNAMAERLTIGLSKP